MKYPQLVSTRAVNAISDWLVSRLEQLGVEAPQIYTRLLLSLLQSSVQINDPIEFNSLETFIGNRKGGSIKRYHLPCDANSLKKLNAVQCLSEIVSSEQELTAIESLVDELWEKLNDIEKQLEYSNGDETILINNLMSSTTCVDKSKVNTTTNGQTIETSSQTNLSKNCKKNYNNEKRTIICRGGDVEKSIELETDPKKRYFNAFPALSKEMEDSFRIWRRNSKSLTWPADRANIIAKNPSLNLPNSLPTSSCEIKSSKSTKNDDLNVSKLDQLSNGSNHAIISTSTGGGLKRRTRRRKSQSMSKGRAMPNTRKTALNDNVINVMSTTGNSGGHRRSNRHMSPTQWDTDFEGYWEMGRDLIKEFFAKQSDKNQNQNRCNSANRVCSMNKTEEDAAKEMETQSCLETEKFASSSPLMPPVDISFCLDDSIDDDDTYKSIVELTADNSNNKSRSSPRRLYQRLALPDSPIDGDDREISTSTNEVQADIMQLKAKFNSNIASLWQNNSDDENTIHNNDDESSLWSVPRNLQWPHVAPIKENLKNFWTNFYNQQFELPNNSQTEQQQQQQQQQKDQQISLENYPELMDMNGCSSLPYKMASMPNVTAKTIGNNDFHSMPFHLEGLDMTDGGGGVTGRNKIYKKLDGRRTPVGVFLQDSIWSENLNGGKNTDTDESFYLKVWNSNRKLYNLDAIYEKKIPEGTNESKINAPSFQFSSYGNSRWSEGINAEPNMLQIQRKSKQNDQIPLNTCNRNETLKQSIDCIDASISATTTTTTTSCSSSSIHTLSSSGIFSDQTPSIQSSSIQLNDNAEPPLSEVYGGASPINDDCQLDAVIENNEKMSPVSLSNHSNESSGFVEYSRIKSFSQAAMKQQQQQQQCNYPRSKEQQHYYLDDTNENLLTSERTHFQPIRAYADGYTFDVCSALEVIEYKRSDSGYLYFESEKYLEYTRKDTFMAEEENNGNVAISSAAPLYAGSNCEAAISQKRKKENNNRSEQLVLKFRIKNEEIACQTEDEATITSMYAQLQQQQEQEQEHPLYLIFSSNVAEGLKIPTTGRACNNAIEALNKAVAAAAKAAAASSSSSGHEQERIQLDTPWLRLDELIDTNRNTINHGSSMIWTALQDTTTRVDEITGIDEIDFCNESSLSSSCIYGNNSMDHQQQWSSMRRNSIEKNCQLNGRAAAAAGAGAGAPAAACCPAESENNNLMQQNNAEMHSLWGMCAVCNNYKSAPANHLLRDELKIEADEIMSDLKNMQDLYIGCDQDTDADDMDSYCSGDYFWGRHGNEPPRNLQHPYPITMKPPTYERCDNERKTNDWLDENGLVEARQKETQQKVLQQVNKLIADLMRPEKANDTNVLADAAASAHRELGESFWPDDGGEHNIWKQHNDSCSRNSLENQSVTLTLRPSRYSILCAEEKKFLAQLTWEHDNLAEIWTKSTPPLKTTNMQQHQESHQQPKQSLPSTPLSKPPTPPVLLCSSSADVCAKQCLADNSDVPSSPITSTNIVESHELVKPMGESILSSNNGSVTATNVNYKRIQQFLNSTGASNGNKLKLSNRKRRHSASQNYAMLYNNGLMNGPNHKTNNSNNNNNNNNNNNTKVSDLNNYNFKRNATNKTVNNNTNDNDNDDDDEKSNDTAVTVSANYTEDIDMIDDDGHNDDSDAYFLIKNNGDMNMILPPPKQTIITCQYWTTIDPIMDTDVNDDGTSFSCLVDKNNTILKHVTMLARPLTR